MRKCHGLSRIQSRRSVTAVVEGLEARQLLSGYGYQQLAKFSYAQLTTPVGTPAEDSAGDIFFFADIGESRQQAVWELAKGAAAPTMVASFPAGERSDANTGIVIDSSGDLFGTDGSGGTNSVVRH
jgi:hypothetical protein